MSLSKKKLSYFKERLTEEMKRTLKLLQVDDNVREIRDGDRVPCDEADQAVSLANQTLTFAMRKRELQKIREIDAALRRLDDGTFGICEESGDPIEERRLEVQPWTRVSLEAARELEAARKRESTVRGTDAYAM